MKEGERGVVAQMKLMIMRRYEQPTLAHEYNSNLIG